MSVTEVADTVGVSDPTVVRACQQVGTRGFQDLKVTLARELVEPMKFIHEDVDAADDTATVIGKVIGGDVRALMDTLEVLDPQEMERAVKILREARRITFFGVGVSGPIAEEAHRAMGRIGLDSIAVTDPYEQMVRTSLAGPETAVVAISHTGSTKEPVDALRAAKKMGAKTVCITNYGKSPIQAHADVVLHTAVSGTLFRTDIVVVSRVAHLAVVNALWACVAMTDRELSSAQVAQGAESIADKRF